MAIVTIFRSKSNQFPYYYHDRAQMKVWSGAVNISYGWTKRDNVSWPTKFVSSQTRSQPTDWDYRARIRNHQNATTNLVGTKYKLVSSGERNFLFIDYEAVSPNDGVTWLKMYWHLRGMVTPVRNPPPDPGSISLADADRDARLKFLRQVRKNYESFQGLTFLGELRETVHMLRNPISALGRGMSDYLRTVKKRANRSNVNSLNRMVSGTWLEYVYGWSPLINDITNIKEMLNERLNRYEDSFERVSGVGEVLYAPSSWSAWNFQNGPWTIHLEERSQSKGLVRYYGQAFRAAQYGSDFVDQTTNLGLGLSSFVPTIWELIPYSFVADYFSNTGKLLEAVTTNTSGVKWCSRDYLRIGSMTTRYRGYSRNTTTQPDAKTRNVRVTGAFDPHVMERRNVERSWLTGPPSVGLSDFQWKIPGTGSTQWVNLTALAAQQSSVQKFLTRVTNWR